MIKIGLADDHSLFRTGISNLLNSELEFKVVLEAESGEQFLEMISQKEEPDIAIIDIKMNGMSGFELAEKLTKKHPNIKIIALSMFMDENKVIKMLKCGAKSYILKGSEPWELIHAISNTHKHGYYSSDAVSKAMLNKIDETPGIKLKEKEISFIQYCCSEMTYKEIAEKMNVSFRTIDGYRDRIFVKLNVKNRIGVVLYAIKNKIFNIESAED